MANRTLRVTFNPDWQSALRAAGRAAHQGFSAEHIRLALAGLPIFIL